MNASVREDFGIFVAFIDSFSLKDLATSPERIALVKQAHSQFLALLTTTGELLSGPSRVHSDFLEAYQKPGTSYLGEVVSDCSEFVMCVLLGMYRSAGGTLRSAIESYLKAFSAKEQPLILQRTSVPDVFNDAAGVGFFSSAVGKIVIAELKGVYSELNAYVHTVSEEHMFGALAIGNFPRWSERNEKLVEIFVRTVRLFLYGIVGSRRDLYDRFDHRNRVITNRAMTRSQRRSAMGLS